MARIRHTIMIVLACVGQAATAGAMYAVTVVCMKYCHSHDICCSVKGFRKLGLSLGGVESG